DAKALAELRLARGAVVAREARLAGSREGGHGSCLRVVLTHATVPGVGQVDAAIGPDGQAVHSVERCFRTRTTVAVVPLFAQRPPQREEPSVRLDGAEPRAAHHPDKIDPSVGPEVDAERLDELRARGRCTARALATAGDEHDPIRPGRPDDAE